MPKQSILLRGSETHTSASKQISLPVSHETGAVQKGKKDTFPESSEAEEAAFRWACTAEW